MANAVEYILMWLVAFIGSSSGLSCYHCRSPRVSDCTTTDMNQKIVSCGTAHPDYLQFCIFKVVFDFPLQTTVASSNCESVPKSPTQNWQTIERDFCQSGYNQQVHQCRICLTDLCNNPALPYLQNAGPGPYMPNMGPGSYIPNTGPGSYGYIPSPPRPPQTYGNPYRGVSAPVVLNNSPCLALFIAAIVHLLTN